MKEKTDYPRELCEDEAVCFIASRHNVTPRQLLSCLHAGQPAAEAAATEGPLITLEPNEIEILRGLTATVAG